MREYFASLGRIGGKRRTKKKLAAIRRNIVKATRVNRALARQKKTA